MLLIKNDPQYNECWPRAVVPYERIHGVAEPQRLPRLANDGRQSPHLPASTPLGLIGTSSLYKRESYPNGVVPPGKVTAQYAGDNDPWKGLDRDEAAIPGTAGLGWFLDDTRPTLTIDWPQPGDNRPANEIRIGMFDFGSGLNLDSLLVTADFPLAGSPAKTNLADRLQQETPGVLKLSLAAPLAQLDQGTLTVSVRDRQGNETRIVRKFSVRGP